MRKIDKVRELMRVTGSFNLLDSMYTSVLIDTAKEKKIGEQSGEYKKLQSDFERIKEETTKKVEGHIKERFTVKELRCLVEFFDSPRYKRFKKVSLETFQIINKNMEEFLTSIGVECVGGG